MIKEFKMLQAIDIKKKFGGNEVLKGVTVRVDRGEVVAIIGRSGSGKSTLLRCLNHLETIDSGEIRIDGQPMVTTGSDGIARYQKEKDLRGLCLKMGLVFQDYNLFPHYTVLRNLVAPQQFVLRRSRQEAEQKAMLLLEKVGLADKAGAYPCNLSGGQCQRVAIARAIVGKPKLLLADEPTGALDSASGAAVMELFQQLHESGSTIIMITHDHSIANHAAKVMTIRDGVLSGGDDYE
jgi:polar amino acid transport system ATP-binding protein